MAKVRHDLIVFISGPITDKEDYKAAFDAAEKEIVKKGWIPINPTVLPDCLPDRAYMPICIAMIEQADAVLALEGWEDSLGAKTEVFYALRQGKLMLYPDKKEDVKK